MVPLSDAWKSGAGTWVASPFRFNVALWITDRLAQTTAKRQSFANDLTNPQLIAVRLPPTYYV